MKTRKVIYADEGKVLTDGKIYGKRIYLGEGIDVDKFYEISDAEYARMLEEKSKEQLALMAAELGGDALD